MASRPVVLPEHVRELIGILLWKITEADGKYNTRYRTQSALTCEDRTQLRHEHVYQRSKMIDALLQAELQDVEQILQSAVACTVTVQEHLSLNQFDEEYGWERYRKAGLVVIDMLNGERFV